MIKRLAIIVMTLVSVALGGAAQTAATASSPSARAFASAPQNVFPLLDRNTRLDLIDYAVNNLSTPAANELAGHSAITEITPTDLTVKLTDSSSAQLCVLPAGRDSVIVLITTVAAPGLDSSLSVYTKDWAPLPTADVFKKPGWKEWFTPDADKETVLALTPFMLASYRFDPATSTLTLTNNLQKFLDADTYSQVEPSLQKSLTYVWNNRRFVAR